MSALDQLCSQAALGAAFKRLRDKTKKQNRSVVGVDNVSIESFNRNQDALIAALSRALKLKTFSFSALRPVFVQKPGPAKKYRLICVPTVADRVVQGVLHERLSKGDPCGLDNGVSYGFIRGKGVEKAVIRAKELRAKYPYVYKTDISSFFDRIPRDTLKELIKRRVRERSLHSLLCAAVDCEVMATERWEKQRINDIGINAGSGVRQGMPLSPFFANLLLVDFDKTVEANGFRMVRYADDLIFFSDSIASCESIHSACKDALNRLGLSIPDIAPNSKTRIYEPHQGAEFLGVELVKDSTGYRLEIADEQADSVRETIMKYADGPQLLARGITFTRYGRSLESTAAGYMSAYGFCDNFDEFEKKVSAWKSDAMQRLLKNWLRVPIAKLDESQKKFLEIP